MSKNKAASVRQRLLNRAREQGDDFNLLMTQYVNERFLYRLSRSHHCDHFIVKGATLFLLWEEEYHRPTRDIDLLHRVGFLRPEGVRGTEDIDIGQSESASVAEVEQKIREIMAVSVPDDGIEFLPETVHGVEIRENQAYQGVRIEAVARIGSARQTLKLDIGFGDVVIPSPVEARFPVLLDGPKPLVKTYSVESVIAEKFEAMVSLGMANSRMKDYYDIYQLIRNNPFVRSTVSEAVSATFARRRRRLPEGVPLGLSHEFATSEGKVRQWGSFLSRSRIDEARPLEHVVSMICTFLLPALAAIGEEAEESGDWIWSRDRWIHIEESPPWKERGS